ncbi:MAG TPA: zinc-dependent alcohol dehydrogenase family protein [Gemmatimonadaceae bacterium]
MRAMVLDRERVNANGQAGLRLVDAPAPEPAEGELLVRVNVCGVCRTDLDLVEGRLVPPRYPIIPGHQIVGFVERMGAGATGFDIGQRVGIAWIHWACGVCNWCLSGMENLCPYFRSTGCDANGGYAEFATVPAAFAYPIPRELSDEQTAPLLCAGAIGWRSLRLTNLRDGEPLGLTGFGASAHLVLQLARARLPQSEIYVFARSADEREFARSLGATWTGATDDMPPVSLRAIIDTTPAWRPVVRALRALEPGGRLVINAIRKSAQDVNELTTLDYGRDLWMEREIKSVANVTRTDVAEMLAFASSAGIRPRVVVVPLERANDALNALHSGGAIRGAQVLRVAAS